MDEKFKKMFEEVDDLLCEIYQKANKEGDEDAKNASSYLLETMDSLGMGYDENYVEDEEDKEKDDNGMK